MTLSDLIAAKQVELDVLLKARFEEAALRTEIARLKAMSAALPSADTLWRWNADTVAPFSIQARDPARVSIVTVGGVKWARLLTMPGDSGTANAGDWERTDMQYSSDLVNGAEGRERWIRNRIIFPADYVQPPKSAVWSGSVVLDWHNSLPGAGQANMEVRVMPAEQIDPTWPTGMGIQMAWGDQAKPNTKWYPIGPVTRLVPYDFKQHVFWTAATTGFFKAWVNGRLVMEYTGPTLYTGQGTYIKLANYHSPHAASAVLHGPMVLAKTEAGLA